MSQSRIYVICIVLFALAPLAGCELVADFDRKLIPVEKTDASVLPVRDAGDDVEDASADDDASSATR